MPDLKTISKEAIPRAMQKAERYRLLNQSWATESICLDILEVDPTNQPVLVMLLLAITDQFGARAGRAGAPRARGARARSPTRTSARTTPASSPSGSRHAQLTSGAMHAEAMASRRCARRWSRSRRPSSCASPATTTRSCAGTPASARWTGMRRQEIADEQYEPSSGSRGVTVAG